MANRLQFDSLWDDENFSVQRGVIPAKATVDAYEIGQGIIYFPNSPNLSHRVAGTLNIETSFPDVEGKIRSVWNPGSEAKIVNHSSNSIDFFRISLKYNPQLIKEISEDEIGSATHLLLHGDWDKRFKTSVQADLEAIRRIVPQPSISLKPSHEDIALASLAKEDLEFKLEWFSEQARRLNIPVRSFESSLATSSSTSSPTGLISVTVRTKDPQGGPDVMNCTVFANLGGYGTNKANVISFSNVSSPTTDNLCVAIYNIWAEKGGKSGPQRLVRIGRTSSSPNSQTVDVFAP